MSMRQAFFFCSLLTLVGLACQSPAPSSTADEGKSRFVTERSNPAGCIVFVHGVLGNALSTWTNDETDAYWPEILANDEVFKNWSVFVHEYPTRLLSSAPTIHELSDHMYHTLLNSRVLDHQSLVFVCHSMGGLVTRSFLIDRRELVEKVHSLHLYGVPTSGSQVANVASIASKNPQFRDMGSGFSGTFLEWQLDAWLRSFNNDSVNSYCVYEQRETHGVMVVKKTSAALLCNRSLSSVDANHLEIVKPRDKDSYSHVLLRNNFRSASNEAKSAPEGDRFELKLLLNSIGEADRWGHIDDQLWGTLTSLAEQGLASNPSLFAGKIEDLERRNRGCPDPR